MLPGSFKGPLDVLVLSRSSTLKKPPKSIIGSFFRRMRSRSRSQERKVHANGVTPEVTPSRSHDALTTKQRSKSTSFPTKEDSNDVNRNSKKWGAKQLLNRMSFRSRERIRSEKDSSPPTTPVQRHVGFASETDLFRPGAEVSFPSPMMDSPRGVSAVSDLDLRFVTMRRDFNADLGDSTARAFMSENDLTSSAADFDMPARTPSYLRISKALNGYTKSPVRKPETEAKQMMGESIVERRLRMFDHPHEKTGVVDDFASPVTTSKSHSNTDFSRSPIQPQTPISSRLQPSHMGNNFSTPGPIRDLISRFDKLDLCNFEKSKEDEKDTENIPPHSIVINQQPDFEEEACKKPVEIDDTTDTNSENPHETDNPPPSRISIDVESDSGISGSGNYSPESTKRDGEPATAANINATLQNISGQVAQSPKSIDLNPHDGEGFAKLHDFVRDDLSAKIEAAKEDLENVKLNIPYILSSSRRNWMDYAQKDKTKDRKTMLSTLSTTRLDF
ncbi:unnamed protein product [Caenorhabditis auriculariae]|uniref:Uncharacterized protein n=1 Tax=Caenorhabditis auriculariae TaxID=2777116 RepID=A0A8S1HS96_9PELO|nr:unnamed protein product [Caenorhabditis auriculariae]